MKTFDFYKGFEGEPELKVSQINKNKELKTQMKLWIGYLDSIVDLMEPNAKGSWEGLPLYYHTETAWYDEQKWECKEVSLFIRQLEDVNKAALEDDTKNVLSQLIDMLKDAQNSGDKVYFEYE